MGELADDFRAMKEDRMQRRADLEPQRAAYATKMLTDAGHDVRQDPTDNTCLLVNGKIKYWPFTGWYSGKGVGSGRGIANFVKALRGKDDVA